ncbi:lytic transglycosylase [Aeromonas cavernicola]|uniref:Lytic transglycosylase n=1 Tax=Aeromonas cavernicola TaxID=1006623 RepID=A0A2H9U4N7_9GAMM|nr:LysM peptidoglycan-binding domain-containing protein [Aeromonas cavernicola]PJG59005.1 lytic transglycosylase [Aeromonas cavernicola]
MKARTALLAALVLSGCQNLSHQDDRALAVLEPIKSSQVNKKAHKKYASGMLFGDDQIDETSSTDNLWVRISDDMQLDTTDNERIRKQREWLLRNDNHLATIASRAEPYLYLIVEEIERRGLPMELVTIPMIESMFDPHARSRSNAVGLWQFVPATGKNFGLRRDNWYDGRRDVLASTSAALDYIQYLNRFFDGDWLQTLAAYNAGEGRVRNAIQRNQRAGRPTDYWSLDLPRETQMYVPKILAMADMISNADKYNVTLPVLANEPKLRVVNTGGQLDLNVAAQLAGLRTAQLKEVNPALSRGVTSPKGPYRLLVPVEYADTLELALADLPKNERVRTRTYQVASGDTLSRIAQNQGVSVAELKLANNLRSNNLRRGQQLAIPANGQPSKALTNTTKPQQLASRTRSKAKVQYQVRSGDNLWSISQVHGISHNELAKWNGLKANASLKPGMKLVVYSPKRKSNQSMVYQVKRGDSISSIAARFQVAINDVMRWNQLDKTDYLKPGQELTLFVKNNS